MSAASTLSTGDAFGFGALILIGLAAILMLMRSKLLTLTKNLNLIRGIHIAISTLAGAFLILHITSLFTLPVSNGIILGYVAVGAAVIVWLSGTAFLERLRDSLFFHGSMTAVLVGLSVMHAAVISLNIPTLWAQLMLGGTVLIMLANASYHLVRAVSH